MVAEIDSHFSKFGVNYFHPRFSVWGTLEMNYFYAHSQPGINGPTIPEEEWENLFTTFNCEVQHYCRGISCFACENLEPFHGHLNKVAYWASRFAEGMAVLTDEAKIFSSWGYLAGLWHDLGKYSIEFQNYLLHTQGDAHEAEFCGRVDHSTAGAQHAVGSFKLFGHCIAYGIAGHHSGLLNAQEGASQRKRLNKKTPEIPQLVDVPKEVQHQEPPVLPAFLKKKLEQPEKAGFSVSFFTRMLFSCLVDADFLATEAFMNPGQSSKRNQVPAHVLQEIEKLFHLKIESFGTPDPSDIVNR